MRILAAPADDSAGDAPVAAVPVAAATRVADLEIAGRYVPAGPTREPVAGDFWDVLQLGGGRIGLVVGDVSGHGEQAVGRMRALRATARSYAMQDLGPASLLARLDAFMDRQGPEEMATLWYGEYDPATGLLVHASAGHPPPVVTVDGAAPVLLGVTDAPPLGTGLAHTAAREHRAVLPVGAVLVAYTDGLIERRESDIGDGLTQLTQALARALERKDADDADAVAQDILDALVAEPAQAEDDVCLLVVRRLS